MGDIMRIESYGRQNNAFYRNNAAAANNQVMSQRQNSAAAQQQSSRTNGVSVLDPSRRNIQAASSQQDMRLYGQMTALIDTRQAAQRPNALTNRTSGSILGGGYSTRDTSSLMSARNQLADTNIARASIMGNRNSVVGRYQQFMRDSTQQYAKHTLQRFV